MVLSLIVLACLVAGLSFLEETRQTQLLIALGLAVVFILLAGFRPVGADSDSQNYVDFYYSPGSVIEASFSWIVSLSKNAFGGYRAMFVIYVVLGVAAKLYGICRLSKLLMLSLLVYVCNFFILHEMTQMRVGVAAGLFLIALYHIAKHQRWKALLFIVLAAFFHLSAVVLLPFLFTRTGELRKWERWICLLALPVAYFFYFTKLDLLGFVIPIPDVQERIEAYQKLMDEGIGDRVNVFGLVFLMRVGIYYLLMWKEKLIRESYPLVSLLLRLECVSLFCFVFFSFFAVASFRLSELFGAVEVVLIPCLYYIVKPARCGKLLVAMVSFALLLINLFYIKLLV